ncbi:MAG: GNAT family N-acetyltransferase [Ferruginibacter sp.]
MSSLIYTTSKSKADLSGIIELQKTNLAANLTREEISCQGFVTVVHSFPVLKKMNDIEQHIICKDKEKVIAYLLAMTAKSKNDIPVLLPMFETFDKIVYKGKPVSSYNYMVVGQVCVDKNYRGQGILDKCYDMYKSSFKDRYDFAITEIAGSNLRSINAHKRIGFSEVKKYTISGFGEWSIVIFAW